MRYPWQLQRDLVRRLAALRRRQGHWVTESRRRRFRTRPERSFRAEERFGVCNAAVSAQNGWTTSSFRGETKDSVLGTGMVYRGVWGTRTTVSHIEFDVYAKKCLRESQDGCVFTSRFKFAVQRSRLPVGNHLIIEHGRF